MKPIKIILLVALAIFMVALGLNFSESASIYTDFETAQKSGKEVHIVGKWVDREKAFYDADRDIFTFMMQDTLQRTEQVIYRDPKPINFEQAEKVVVIGAYNQENYFVADKIVMKCPSKYEPTDITSGEN